MINGATHSLFGPISVDESSKSGVIRRLAHLGVMELSNRYEAAVVCVGFHVMDCEVSGESIIACYDRFEFRILHHLDSSAPRE